MNPRVSAFTILEITIAMLIAGLLVALTYTSYAIIAKSYHAFTVKNGDMTVLLSLDHVMARDFDRAELILKETDGITLKNDTQLVKYIFTPGFITRTSTRTDTFKVQAGEVNTSFENMPLNAVQTTAEENRVSDLDFTLDFQHEKIPCHYHKLYSSDNLIERNPHAVN
jgi:Tfp pilus assembly protein PilE